LDNAEYLGVVQEKDTHHGIGTTRGGTGRKGFYRLR
jgi:hypothetical protein